MPFNLDVNIFSSLIFLSPTIEPMGFWEVLWAVGITNFIIKFLFMGIKCLILLLPSSLVTHRTQVRVVEFFFGLLVKIKCLLNAMCWYCRFTSSYFVVYVSRGGG